mmetsp:Transcript_15402/g.28487  ORF Transcript_15402/g.28487 Transcript_15402/m.28487 type:complete len:310 (+) Transcript_15402:44-973(+)
MSAIAITGNYGFFNMEVLGLAMSILDDSMLPISIPVPCIPLPHWAALALLPAVVAFGLWLTAACGLALLQLPRLSGVMSLTTKGSLAERAFSTAQKAHESLYPLGIGHMYGPFAGMTTFRWELIFELSHDAITWTQLEFPYKPGCINTRPRWMPLGHFQRLDWRLWFVPLSMGRGRWDLPDWVEGFITQLLRGSEPVAALTMSRESIVRSPPKFVRVSVWDYHFSSCDPRVHQCPQVSVSKADYDVAYTVSSWWQPPAVQAPVCSCDDIHDNKAYNEKPEHVIEWGCWWYRRLVARCGVYHLRGGRLHF